MNVEGLARLKQLPENWLIQAAEVQDLPGGGVAVPYFDQDGSAMFERTRDVPGRPRFEQPKGVCLAPYGLWRLADRDGGTELFLCEGESDAWALWHAGLCALGLPGADSAACLTKEHLAGWTTDRLYLCPDGDDAGRRFALGMQTRLTELGFPGRVSRVILPAGCKDVSDFRGREPGTFPKRWRELVGQAEPVLISRPQAQAAGSAQPPLFEAVLIRLSDVSPEPVRWLWPGWLPEGALCLLDGDPGLGKSTLTLDLAARVSTGRAMPPLEGPDVGRRPAAVLLLGAEDSLRHTVRPRLDAAGADSSLVYSLEGFRAGDEEREVVLPHDLFRVEAFIKENNVKLIVADPLMAFLGTDYDAHKDQDIRRCLKPLARLAERLDVTVLLLRHLNKVSGSPAMYRGNSSIGIIGAARAALICGRDPEADRHVLAMNKLNLAGKPPSLAFRLEAAGMASRITWDGEADLRPDEILGHGGPRAKKSTGRPADALAEARQMLTDLLAAGPVSTAEVQAAADRALIGWRTVAKAKSDMGIRSTKRGSTWFWSLPEGCNNSTGCMDGENLDSDVLDPDEGQSATESDIPFD